MKLGMCMCVATEHKLTSLQQCKARRHERNGDRNPHGERCIVADEHEPERTTTRHHEFHRPIAGLPLPQAPYIKWVVHVI
jgi:hypothetical protein